MRFFAACLCGSGTDFASCVVTCLSLSMESPYSVSFLLSLISNLKIFGNIYLLYAASIAIAVQV